MNTTLYRIWTLVLEADYYAHIPRWYLALPHFVPCTYFILDFVQATEMEWAKEQGYTLNISTCLNRACFRILEL